MSLKSLYESVNDKKLEKKSKRQGEYGRDPRRTTEPSATEDNPGKTPNSHPGGWAGRDVGQESVKRTGKKMSGWKTKGPSEPESKNIL